MPPEGIGIIIGVDRVLDMMRTTVNVGSDVVTAAVVDRQMRRANPDEPADVTAPPAATAAVD